MPAPRKPTPVMIVETTRDVSVVALERHLADEREEARAERDDRERPQARGLVAGLAVEPDERPKTDREHEPEERFDFRDHAAPPSPPDGVRKRPRPCGTVAHACGAMAMHPHDRGGDADRPCARRDPTSPRPSAAAVAAISLRCRSLGRAARSIAAAPDHPVDHRRTGAANGHHRPARRPDPHRHPAAAHRLTRADAADPTATGPLEPTRGSSPHGSCAQGPRSDPDPVCRRGARSCPSRQRPPTSSRSAGARSGPAC